MEINSPNSKAFKDECVISAAVEREKEMPHEVRLALRVILNHIEPGWENCQKLVAIWLDGNYQP